MGVCQHYSRGLNSHYTILEVPFYDYDSIMDPPNTILIIKARILEQGSQLFVQSQTLKTSKPETSTFRLR